MQVQADLTVFLGKTRGTVARRFRPLGSALQNFGLVAQDEVLDGQLLPGAERGGERKKDDFEHPGMLCSPLSNRNGDKADGVFGSDRDHHGLPGGTPSDTAP